MSPLSVNTEMKNRIVYPPHVLRSQNSTASFPNNQVMPLLTTKISRGWNNWQLSPFPPLLWLIHFLWESWRRNVLLGLWKRQKGSSSLQHVGQGVILPIRNSPDSGEWRRGQRDRELGCEETLCWRVSFCTEAKWCINPCTKSMQVVRIRKSKTSRNI